MIRLFRLETIHSCVKLINNGNLQVGDTAEEGYRGVDRKSKGTVIKHH